MLKPFLIENRLEAGCDEAGRGCLAGPVFAAAVILDPEHPIPELNDSKKLSLKKREALRSEIEQKALCWSVGICDVEEIDEINILQASVKAMHKAISNLKSKPEHLLIDGNYFRKFQDFEYTTVVKGDGKFSSIAAASILAKTHRDEFMCNLDREFPGYGYSKHKGYATAQHIEAIKKLGYSLNHRKSFTLKKLQLELF
ncbi:ribonuclease HII [bacterium]|nr:ribonuclease HII [bacterium]